MPDCYVRPLFVLGDSHCASLNAFLLRDEATGEPVAFGESICVQGLSAFSTFRDGEIHPGILGALAGFHMLRLLPAGYEGDVPSVAFGGDRFAASWIAESTYVLFTVGELDAREVIASVPPDAEPVLPFPADLSRLPSGAPSRTVVASSELQERVLRQLRPFFQALVALRQLGIRRIALASIPPPNPDDEEYARVTGLRSSARTRHMIHLLVNSVLRAFCEQADVRFIDTWDAVTDGNVAKPGLFVDGLHQGAIGAQAALRRYHELATEYATP
jgi:hypothetical protein